MCVPITARVCLGVDLRHLVVDHVIVNGAVGVVADGHPVFADAIDVVQQVWYGLDVPSGVHLGLYHAVQVQVVVEDVVVVVHDGNESYDEMMSRGSSCEVEASAAVITVMAA
jgi:hypothetical protein